MADYVNLLINELKLNFCVMHHTLPYWETNTPTGMIKLNVFSINIQHCSNEGSSSMTDYETENLLEQLKSYALYLEVT